MDGMKSMLKRTLTALACTAVLLGMPTPAAAADPAAKLPRPGGATPAAVCDILPIFWWCP